MKAQDSFTPRVLIADDQADVLEALRLLLKSERYQLETVKRPADVITAIEERDFDESGYRYRPVMADEQRKRKLRGWIHNALRPEGPRDRDVLVVSVIDDVAIEDPIKVEMTPIGIDNGVPPLLF